MLLLAVLPLAAACSINDVVFSSGEGPDGGTLPGPSVLTIVRDGTAEGTVRGSAGGLDCGASCSATLEAGAQLTLTATPAAGAVFAGWSGGGCSGTSATCQLTVGGATTVTATFNVAEYAVTLDLGGAGTGRVVGSLGALDCPGACTGRIAHGSRVTLTASAAAGSDFVGWTVGTLDVCGGTGPCALTVTGPLSITATFARQQSLEVVKTGTGTGTVTSNPAGIDCGADCSEVYPPATMVTLTASASADSTFMGWTGACAGTGSCTVSINGAVMATASFARQQRTLTVSKAGAGAGTVTSDPAGITCGATCAIAFDVGSPVTLTAAPAAGSMFTGWSGGGCSGTGACTVTLNAATAVTATFQPILHVLTVTRAGTGAGAVTSNPAGISCGATCSASYAQGSMVTLTAAASPGSTFAGWSGACVGTGSCTVSIAAATAVTATFTALPFDLTVTRAGTGSGTVTSSPAGISCGADCVETYLGGTSVTLTASPAADSAFTGWSGACTGTGPCTVTMTAVTAVTATFALNTYALTVIKNGSGAGSVVSSPAGIVCGGDCSEVYAHGTMVTLTATAAGGSTFAGWSGGGCSGTSTCTVTMSAATDVGARFTTNDYPLNVAKAGTGAGTVTSSPAGINCGATCSAPFRFNTTVTLTATPAVGSTFAGWTGGGCTGTGPCTVTMSAAVDVMATFTLNTYALTVIKNGSGAGSVVSSPAGISCGGDCSEVYAHGTMVTLTASAAGGSTFAGWSGGGCSGTSTCTVTLTAATDVGARFTTNDYPLNVAKAGTGAGTVTSSPAGINCGATCTAPFRFNTTVTLTATPAVGSTFAGWTGGGCSGTGPCTVTMSAAVDVMATFTLNTYALTVIKNGSGAGSVVSSPAGISCGGDCSEVYAHGTVVTLTASAAGGSTFAGWSGGGCSGTSPCTVTMSAATDVGARFTTNDYALSVAKAGAGAGTVTSSPAGINCGATCTALYPFNTTVTLTATAAGGSTFAGWSGGGCSGTGPCTVTMTAATAVTATFTLNAYLLTVIKNGSGAGYVSSSPAGIDCGGDCGERYPHGTVVTLTASAAMGSTFAGWSGGGCSGTGPCTVTVTADTDVGARFTTNDYALSVARAGTGAGTVTSSPAGINCGATCTAPFRFNTTVTLTATPAFGSIFTGWSGGGCSGTGPCIVTMTADTAVTATFSRSTVTLSVQVASAQGYGGTTVTSSDGAINCNENGTGICSASFATGSTVTLTLNPGEAAAFNRWIGACAGQGQFCTLTLTSDASTVGLARCVGPCA